MRRRVVRSFLLALVALAAFAPAASAAPVAYSLSLGYAQHDTLTLDGGQLTALSILVPLTACGDGGIDGFVRVNPSPLAIPLVAGALHVEGDTVLQDIPGSSVHVVLDATVSLDAQLITGTLTLSGASAPGAGSCPPTIAKLMAIPTPGATPPDPGRVWTYSGANISADGGTTGITRLRGIASFLCGAAVDAVDFDSLDYGGPVIPVAPDGSFALTLHVLDEYASVRLLTVSGTVTADAVKGRFSVTSTDVGGTFLPVCAGERTFEAFVPGAGSPAQTVPAPTPVPVTKPGLLGSTRATTVGPSTAFQWMALRRQTGRGFRFYFLAAHVHCQRGATHVRIAFDGGLVHTVRCGASLAWASGPLEPGRGYFARSIAVKLRRHRLIKQGRPVVTDLRMPQANATWLPIGRVPGRPPRS